MAHGGRSGYTRCCTGGPRPMLPYLPFLSLFFRPFPFSFVLYFPLFPRLSTGVTPSGALCHHGQLNPSRVITDSQSYHRCKMQLELSTARKLCDTVTCMHPLCKARVDAGIRQGVRPVFGSASIYGIHDQHTITIAGTTRWASETTTCK